MPLLLESNAVAMIRAGSAVSGREDAPLSETFDTPDGDYAFGEPGDVETDPALPMDLDGADNQVTLLDLVDSSTLQKLQDSFAYATGVAATIRDTEGNPITQPSNYCKVCEIIRGTDEGRRRCARSGRVIGENSARLMKPTYQRCLSVGFLDGVAPIIVSGAHLANWTIGQINDGEVDQRRIEAYAEEIGADSAEMIAAFQKMESVSVARFRHVVGFRIVRTEMG